MRSYKQAESEFISRLRGEGVEEKIVWLPHEDFALLGSTLVIRDDAKKLDTQDMMRVFAILDDDPCTLALVAVANVAYCTMLMDTFGTENEADFDNKQNVYYLTTAYFDGEVRIAKSKIDWLWVKYFLERIKRPLSSLDYAFSRRQLSIERVPG